MAFHIESSAFCNNGLAPRWTWWIHGIADSRRFGVIGTDEHGRGLYLFQPNGDRRPVTEQLLDAETFSVPFEISKAEAAARVVAALKSLGWQPRSNATAK